MSDDVHLVGRAVVARSAHVVFCERAIVAQPAAVVRCARRDPGRDGSAGRVFVAPEPAGAAPSGRDGRLLVPHRLVAASGRWRARNGLWLKD
jgi:hypothetical protein